MIKAVSLAFAATLAACASVPEHAVVATTATLAEAETAFAQSMADRDFAAFGAFIDDDAVFINGGKPLRGKAEILAHWQAFFVEPAAPFRWKPVIAEVSPANGVGYTEGPVELADGRVIATFYSTWHMRPDGSWRVVFDNGYDRCECRNSP